ncbi:uncharacterized protein TRAVEDRAFT_148998 [Trametes versicolor FP-101664 SS1]|uniref:uncharacterized protein n=1 Tax=Trametes versicolor (strain FP-101664) TaxID=717944 RepID=UPI00046220B8|nr:uncharacterized protein TRAVEDRAFT_148998 [Trametes versicolor FP-101664 SS1]EIW58692.1 hypothetical protein TRAVEDRAFT_148998 [Trametes versicolor FP-101664 SS1]
MRNEFDDGPQEFCDEVQTGDIVINHNQFPSFLYDDSDFDRDRQFKGLFQGDVLSKSYRAIFTGPSSAFKPPGVCGSGRGSISKNYRLDRVIPGSIAYVACLVRFVLSTTEQWEGAVNGTFNGEEFYERIMKVFTNDDFAFETLSAWNAYVYGDATRRRTNAAAQVDLPDEADLILQQLALQAASEPPSATAASTSSSSESQQSDTLMTTTTLGADAPSSSIVPAGPAGGAN